MIASWIAPMSVVVLIVYRRQKLSSDLTTGDWNMHALTLVAATASFVNSEIYTLEMLKSTSEFVSLRAKLEQCLDLEDNPFGYTKMWCIRSQRHATIHSPSLTQSLVHDTINRD